jgi:hypothetical protein
MLLENIYQYKCKLIQKKQENKWNISLSLLQYLINRNKFNIDVFDMLAYKDLPMDCRQLIWKFCLVFFFVLINTLFVKFRKIKLKH